MLYVLYMYVKAEVKLFRKQSKLLGRGAVKGQAGGWGRSQLNLEHIFVRKIKKNNKKTRIPVFLHSPFCYLHTLCNLDFSSTTEEKKKTVQYWKSIRPSLNLKHLTTFTSPKESCLS